MNNRLTNSLSLKGQKYKLFLNKNPYSYNNPPQRPKNPKNNNNNNYLPLIKNPRPNYNQINQLLNSAKIPKKTPSQIIAQQKAKNANKVVNHPYNKKDLLRNRKGLGQINPIFGCGPRRKDNRKIGGGMKISDIPTEEQETAPCPYCGRCFNYVSLAKHSSVCLRVFQSKRAVFDSSSQRAIDDEHRAFMHMSKFDNYKKVKCGMPKWKKESLEFRRICRPIKKVTKSYKNNNYNNNSNNKYSYYNYNKVMNSGNAKLNPIKNNKSNKVSGNMYYNNNFVGGLGNSKVRGKNNNVKYMLKNNNNNNYNYKKAFKPASMGFMSSAPRKFITCKEDYYKNLF